MVEIKDLYWKENPHLGISNPNTAVVEAPVDLKVHDKSR